MTNKQMWGFGAPQHYEAKYGYRALGGGYVYQVVMNNHTIISTHSDFKDAELHAARLNYQEQTGVEPFQIGLDGVE